MQRTRLQLQSLPACLHMKIVHHDFENLEDAATRAAWRQESW